jgi:hypothetical protein
VFPNVGPSQRVQGPGWSECAKQGLAHHPRKGDALLFYRWVKVDPAFRRRGSRGANKFDMFRQEATN